MPHHYLLWLVVPIATLAVSCTDPVKDHAIERLGPEQGGVSEGPEHRPGQPCVLCHSEGGPASAHKFVLAGTVFDTAKGDKGAANVGVYFIDSAGDDRHTVFTNGAGNFYVREEEWPELAFPVKTGVRRANDKNGVPMQSTINREGSCNFCHQPPGADPRASIGPIFAPGGGT